MSTFYEKQRKQRLEDPEFRAHYEKYRAEIDAIDEILSEIEERRIDLGITKADLARLVGRKPESVRRLLSGRAANPTLSTVLEMTGVLGMEITVKPTVSMEKLAPEVKKAARELKAASA